jgi:hemolysin III
MKNRIKLKDRELPKYTKGEEVFNMVTHIVGVAIGIVALVLGIVISVKNHNVYGVVGSSIFGFTMILLYSISSIYHGLSPKLMAKKVFQVLDHCTIFLLIAGSYTPILLCSVREYSPTLSIIILSIIWGVTIIGIILNSIDLKKYKVFSLICYLAMGWCILFIGNKISEILVPNALLFLILGGVSYSVGVIFYVLGNKKKYFHSIFHIFVDIGSIFHTLCILLYIL